MADVRTKNAFSTAFFGVTTAPIVYDQSFYDKPFNVRKQLFWFDGERMYPKYPPVPEMQKEVINHYVTTHGIPKEQMVDFWAEYVDCLLACHNFEEGAPPQFKAWAYGRLCRYVLIERKQKKLMQSTTTAAYDPEHNYLLQPV